MYHKDVDIATGINFVESGMREIVQAQFELFGIIKKQKRGMSPIALLWI
jgi:hypothetical protein